MGSLLKKARKNSKFRKVLIKKLASRNGIKLHKPHTTYRWDEFREQVFKLMAPRLRLDLIDLIPESELLQRDKTFLALAKRARKANEELYRYIDSTYNWD
jgi:hypothetical protein